MARMPARYWDTEAPSTTTTGSIIQQHTKLNSRMNFLDSKTFMAILIIVIVCVSLLGCAKKPSVSQAPDTTQTITDSVHNMQSIASVIGCMFAPNNEQCKKMKAKNEDHPQEGQKDETNEQINKEWEEVDANNAK